LKAPSKIFCYNESVIKKLIFSFLFVSSVFLLFPSSSKAAMVTIKPDGYVEWQVLGDSTLEVKSVAKNLATANSQISLNNTNGKIELNNVDVTNLKEDLVDVQARANTSDLKIGSSGNDFTIEENGITANTSFPITIDPVKNELSVTTSSGSRLISVLPYEGSLSVIRAKLIDKVIDNKVTLNENSDGLLQYSVNGTKNINLFNVASITVNINSTVSATTGTILKVDEPQWLRVFGFIWQ